MRQGNGEAHFQDHFNEKQKPSLSKHRLYLSAFQPKGMNARNKQQKQECQQPQAYYRLLLRASFDPVVVWGDEDRVGSHFWSTTWCKLPLLQATSRFVSSTTHCIALKKEENCTGFPQFSPKVPFTLERP